MRKLWIFFGLLVIPTSLVALDYSNRSLLYTDAPFTPAESAGISVLTALGAIEGNPDGTFQAGRTLNRAEFLKIVLLSHPDIRVSSSDATNCFPDVSPSDWFSKYVCLAKKRDIVGGYPDGTFKPGNAVNYAEALKILGEMYDYTAYAQRGDTWYSVYAQAAKNHKTELPINLAYDSLLTRGQMARLAAAYRAENEGELETYRKAERGEDILEIEEEEVIEEPEEEVEEEEQQSSSQSSEAEEEPEPPRESVIPIPTVSHLLQVGQRVGPIADGRFTVWNEDVKVRIVEVRLERESDSIEKMIVLDAYGTEIGELVPDIYDPNDEWWKGSFDASGAYILPEGETVVLAVEAVLKDIGVGGISAELIEVKEFKLTGQGVDTSTSIPVAATVPHFPIHQTIFGTITDISNAGSATGSVAGGDQQMVGSFAFSGSTVSNAYTRVENLSFDIEASFGVSVVNVHIGTPGDATRHECSKESTARVNCLNVPLDVGSIENETRIINVYADIVLGGVESGRTVQLSITDAGALGENGSVRWTDGTGKFTWLEMEEPLATGTLWEIDE